MPNTHYLSNPSVKPPWPSDVALTPPLPEVKSPKSVESPADAIVTKLIVLFGLP